MGLDHFGKNFKIGADRFEIIQKILNIQKSKQVQ